MKKCPACAREFPPEYNVCPVDGNPLQPANTAGTGAPAGPPSYYPPVPAQTPRRKGLPVWVWVLIGVGVFLFIVVPVVLALYLIPTMSSVKKKANEISAIQTLHTIANAETTYAVTYPANGYACSLSSLGGDPQAGSPGPTAAQIIQPEIAGGMKSGYQFTIVNCTKVSGPDGERVTGYTVTAVPVKVGQTGDRGFCSDESAVIKVDPAGGTNCTQTLGQ